MGPLIVYKAVLAGLISGTLLLKPFSNLAFI